MGRPISISNGLEKREKRTSQVTRLLKNARYLKIQDDKWAKRPSPTPNKLQNRLRRGSLVSDLELDMGLEMDRHHKHLSTPAEAEMGVPTIARGMSQ
jgi:hypothetical protein